MKDLQEKYSLNEETLNFIRNFENNIESGSIYTIQELVDMFESSIYNKEQFNSYKKSKNNAMWWATKRSGNWTMLKRGTYKRK